MFLNFNVFEKKKHVTKCFDPIPFHIYFSEETGLNQVKTSRYSTLVLPLGGKLYFCNCDRKTR